MKLSGRTALVTGASMGIGRETALALARAGADVAINYRSHTELAEEVADGVRKLGRRSLLLQADVADQEAVESMVARVQREFGRLDIFVSNAAYSDRQRFTQAEMDGFRRTIDVAMWGAFYGVRASALQMIKNGRGGCIVVVSSPHAVVAFPAAMAYNMAKAAIDQMARTAAVELLKDRIRVNIIHPGWIDTPGERKFFGEEAIQKAAPGLPWGRLGTPEEIAKGVVFRASDDADYMTGSTLTMDGGIQLPWWSQREEGNL